MTTGSEKMQIMQNVECPQRVHVMHVMQREQTSLEGKNPPQQLLWGESPTPPRVAFMMSNYPV